MNWIRPQILVSLLRLAEQELHTLITCFVSFHSKPGQFWASGLSLHCKSEALESDCFCQPSKFSCMVQAKAEIYGIPYPTKPVLSSPGPHESWLVLPLRKGLQKVVLPGNGERLMRCPTQYYRPLLPDNIRLSDDHKINTSNVRDIYIAL